MITLASPERVIAVLSGIENVFAYRVRAMARYLSDRETVRFYTNGINCALYNENGNAVIYASEKMTQNELEELTDLLKVTASDIRCSIPLDLPGYAHTCGSICEGAASPVFCETAEPALRRAAEIWKAVFPEAFSGEAGMVRYADISLWIRRGMAQAFSAENGAALVFCEEDGTAVIDQLGVLAHARRKGEAMRLLSHIAAVLPCERLLFESKNGASDRFYAKNGFMKTGMWWRYTTVSA